MKQLGYDQSEVRIVGYMIAFDVLVTKARFIGEGNDQILVRFDNLFWSTSERVRVRLLRGALHWQRRIEGMNSFVNNQTTLEIACIPSVGVKDTFLLLRKKMGPNIDLITARKGLRVA